jgi:hypothetical protein
MNMYGGGRVKKALLILFVVSFIYFGSGLVSAFLLEHKAENYMQLALEDISKPWNVNQLSNHASIWMLKKAKLSPQKIVDLSNQELGSFIRFNQKPDCILQQGYISHSATKNTWAICANDTKFEKKSVLLKIRLIQENNEWKINDFISVN